MFELIKKYYASIITYIGLVLFWLSIMIIGWCIPVFLNNMYVEQNYTFDLTVIGAVYHIWSFLIYPLLPICIFLLFVTDLCLYWEEKKCLIR